MPSRKLPPGPTPPSLSGPVPTPPRPPRTFGGLRSLRERIPWLPWVLPLALFLLLTTLEGRFPDFYPLFYTAKMAVIVAVLLALRRFLPEAAPRTTHLGIAVVFGVVLAVLWVPLDKITPHIAALFGSRVGFDPFVRISNPLARILFLMVRFFGLVVIAPVCEELFYRGFLLRFVTDPDDFRRVAMGRFSRAAFWVCIVLMASSHPEWISAAVFSAAMCALLARTRSVFACIAAHGTTNLLLGVYILISHDWKYW